MKKLLNLLFSFVFISQAFAQYEYGEPIAVNSGSKSLRKTRFGLFFAPNNSWMKPTASKSNDGLYAVTSDGAKIGYTWGLMIDHFFADNYGIATGVQLNTTGGKINTTYTPGNNPSTATNIVQTANFDYRLQYFEIPFGLKLLSDDLSGGLRVFGNLGITAGVNISKKATYTVTFTDTSSTAPGGTTIKTATGENEKLRGGLSITPILFQMNLGGGIEYQATDKLSFYLGLFFNNGFAPDATNPKEINMDYKGTFTDGNVRLNNLALKFGIFF